jgi:hypothetical protein
VPDLATVLDDGYVPLVGAADSLARRLPNCATDEFMELLKTALLNGEFDDRPEEIGETGVAWLQTALETSKRRYGFTRCGVVRMMLSGERASARSKSPAFWGPTEVTCRRSPREILTHCRRAEHVNATTMLQRAMGASPRLCELRGIAYELQLGEQNDV